MHSTLLIIITDIMFGVAETHGTQAPLGFSANIVYLPQKQNCSIIYAIIKCTHHVT